MGNKIKILYVDDKVHNLTAFKANFRTEYEIFLCQSGKEGLEILKNNVIHIVIADQVMQGMTGVEFLQESKTNYPEPVKIVVTAHRNIEAIEQAFERGLIFSYHEKPWSYKELKKTIEDAYIIYKNI